MRRSFGAFIWAVLVLGISLGAFGTTITVPDDYRTIQAAIDAAQPGDTVYIKAGRYVENLTIAKPLHLVGEDRTKVVIQSTDKNKDVIVVMGIYGLIFQEDVEIEEIEVTGGDVRNLCIHLYRHVRESRQCNLLQKFAGHPCPGKRRVLPRPELPCG